MNIDNLLRPGFTERNQVVGGSKGNVLRRELEIPLGPVAYSIAKNDRWSVWEKLGE